MSQSSLLGEVRSFSCLEIEWGVGSENFSGYWCVFGL